MRTVIPAVCAVTRLAAPLGISAWRAWRCGPPVAVSGLSPW